ncbi:hypothetical protein COCC4DRAFT_140401 [Bipolaris maydis ATCC 48331]|uniref:Uncharacterized protein n=2 Tax=Cochliobolus heterostrophus TaxID=5016 RepID=M2VC16_COCH5|nr:uncharacterized protein COCC4DRAFT_140401 [Bipolaris maydis ATCC 48331]EMD97238.1 hypothetical protein COCHEDRAFT_1086399 [Bipolaris maydis C5]ENI04301.1 hypothetical protein COCC4DRAFT_140401 [Bipolaris maydis ATCC 48331]
MAVAVYACHVNHPPACSPPTIAAPRPAAADDDECVRGLERAPCAAARHAALSASTQSRPPQPKTDKTGASDVRLSGSLQLHPRKSRYSGFGRQPTCHGACTPRPQRCRPGLRSYTCAYVVWVRPWPCVCVHTHSTKACCLLSVSHIQRIPRTHA